MIDKQIPHKKSININEILFTVTFSYQLSVITNISIHIGVIRINILRQYLHKTYVPYN